MDSTMHMSRVIAHNKILPVGGAICSRTSGRSASIPMDNTYIALRRLRATGAP